MGNGVVDFSVNIPNGTQIAAQLLHMTPRLEASMLPAMSEIISKLHQDAQDNYMDWKHSEGGLEQSSFEVATPWQGTLGYTAPYALRRDKGFSGMTDSLGRTYSYDPGKFYLENSFLDNKAYIESRIGTAVQSAMTF